MSNNPNKSVSNKNKNKIIIDYGDKNHRIKYSILLHALGDTIGYFNANWEFNYDFVNPEYGFVYELISDYVELGGVNCINLKGWRVSDDTVLHIAVGEAMVDSKNSSEFKENIKTNLINSLEDIKTRDAGTNTLEKLKLLEKNRDLQFEFDKYAGGSGASMRSPIIGLFFDKPEDESKIIQTALMSSIITHNHPTGYLGGIATALFTNYAINRINIKEWPSKMLKIIESTNLENFIKQKYNDHYQNFKDYKHSFIGKWKSYVKDKFNENGEIEMKISNLAERGAYYTNNFSWKDPVNEGINFIGSSGDDSLIIAYDSLLDSDDCFEKLIFYSMLHIGDTDTTGCIAGALYGAYYGNRFLPINMENNIKINLEYKKRIETLIDKILKKKQMDK